MGSFARVPEGYERKTLGMGIPLCGGSVGQPGVGSSARDFEVCLKEALEVGCLSLWEFCEGKLERGLPEGYVQKVLETGISIGTPFGEPGGGLVCQGNWERDEKALGMEHLSKPAVWRGPRGELLHCGPWKIC